MEGMHLGFITREIRLMKNLTESVRPWMPEPSMPQINVPRGAEGVLRRQAKRVEGAVALTSEPHRADGKILDREAGRVKFN
jgi:hypothetical protein